MKDTIALHVRAKGWADVDLRIIEKIFPHPIRPSREEVEDMITLALVGNIPPDIKDEPSQAQQLDEWCAENGFRRELIYERHCMRFSLNAKGMAPGREKSSDTTS